MNRRLIIAAAAGLLCAASLQAQDGRPERPAFPEPMSDSLFAATRTQEMVEAYGLSPEQEAQVLELTLQYADKLQFRPMRMGEGDERPDFRSMTEEQRQEFFQKMQEQMGAMQEQMAERREAQKAYEDALKGILDKKQFKAYRKDRRKEEAEIQRRMQRRGGPGGGFPGGGFPGGGFGGPGGGFGGPGGFPDGF